MHTENPPQRDSQRRLDTYAGAGAPPPPGPLDQDAPASMAGATSGIPVVGLGGSAGALESFRRFLAALPVETGAAFVVIQHLAPTHQSLLTELLAQHTRMRVIHAQDAVPVEANCVYVIPPDKYLGIRDGILYLTEPVTQRGIRMPIDFFFRSLAEDRQERAVGILFSGAGSDGTMGVRAVRGAGGLTIAQDPQSAQFGEMPRSAIATGLVDFVFPPDRMAEALLEYLRQPYVRGGEPAAVLEAEGKPGGFTDILAVVRAQTGCDFRYYKKSTTLRRIERRMGLHRIADMAQYCGLLRRDAAEVGQLLQDLLINVTGFFRDADAFEELRRMVIAPLIQAKPPEEPVRAWVAGCASGEEAYSLALLLTEEVATAGTRGPVQVFATDIDEQALQVARLGLYPESSLADVGEARLAQFFVRKEQGYQVNESLRKTVVFAAHNLLTDPPFSKMDLISCRNLLIYLDAETQARLIPLFNFALNPGGYLFLGKSESVGGQTDLFAAVSKQARLYRRHTPARPLALESPIFPAGKRTMPAAGPAAGRPPAAAFGELIRQALLTHFAASVVLVNRRGHVLQFHGQTGKYLNLPTAEPTLNLFDIAKEGLAARIRSALHMAMDRGQPVVLDSIPITREDGAPCVRVTIAPSAQRGDTELLLAVIFEDVASPRTAGGEPVQGERESVKEQLEAELRETRGELQGTIADLQVANQELQAANEEVLSTNEELQSTNEELETSKEELQSLNEELTTVNSQLREKVERLDAANSDLANLLTSTQIATLFLDGELRVRFYTPASTQLFKLIPSDMGRPISDLSMDFLGYDLTADARAVAREASVVEREVQRADGSSWLVRVLPYRTQTAQPDGVVVTFSEVTRLRRAEQQTRRLATVVRDSNDAVILVDTTGKILAWNRGAESMYGWREAEAVQMNLRDLTPPDRLGITADLMPRLLAGQPVASFESQRRTRDGRLLDVWVTAAAIWDESTQRVEGIATTERDITERKRAEAALRRAHDELEGRVQERTVALQRAHDTLEQRVADRTAELARAVQQLSVQSAQLRRLASELTLVEQRERLRLAEVLHDGLQQLLVTARIEVNLLGRREDPPVRQSCQQIGRLLDEAIADSRSLTAELSPPILRTRGLFAGLEWLARWSQEKHHLTVHLQAPAAPLPPLPEDLTALLFQSVRELLFNVVKYAQVPEATVTLAWEAPRLTLTVADAGVGFDSHGLRGEGDLGGGFGLAQIRHRLELLGGCMTVDSAPGQSTRVILTMLLPTADQPAAPPPDLELMISPQPVLAPAPESRRTIRILLVDDHQVVRQALARLLRAEPDLAVVGEASTGTAAVALAGEVSPDVVLMDINMPEMNGIEATRAIHGAFPAMRVIGLSMFDRGDQEAAMRDAGAEAYVSKSAPAEVLFAAIRGRDDGPGGEHVSAAPP
ncbi:MAG TPA: CheR family methyltransferase [Candidatus Methylomirabilis sp.]|nr:CheR family methyltransferase [Candidatus Methylomirabilis sp.]